jgi:hypothetical protein
MKSFQCILVGLVSFCYANCVFATEVTFSRYIEEGTRTCSLTISQERDLYLEVVPMPSDAGDFVLYVQTPEGRWRKEPDLKRRITVTLVFADGHIYSAPGDVEDYSERPRFNLPTDVFRRLVRSPSLTVKLDGKEVLGYDGMDLWTEAKLLMTCLVGDTLFGGDDEQQTTRETIDPTVLSESKSDLPDDMRRSKANAVTHDEPPPPEIKRILKELFPSEVDHCPVGQAIYRSGDYLLRFRPRKDCITCDYVFSISIESLHMSVEGFSEIPTGLSRQFYSMNFTGVEGKGNQRVGGFYFISTDKSGIVLPTSGEVLISDPAPAAVVLPDFSLRLFYSRSKHGKKDRVPPSDIFVLADCE